MASALIEQTKVCTKCGEEKPLSDFGKLSSSPTGVCPRCRLCECARAKNWHQANKQRSNANARNWKRRNRARVSEYNRQYAISDEGKTRRFAAWAKANADRRRDYMVLWNRANPDKANEYNRRRSEKPAHRINNAVRCRIWASLNGAKKDRTFALLGYSLSELVRHLERQFANGMNWDNYGEWHVDHILPLSSFEYKTHDCPEFRAAWALTNLRPMWATDNLKKGAKRFTLL